MDELERCLLQNQLSRQISRLGLRLEAVGLSVSQLVSELALVHTSMKTLNHSGLEVDTLGIQWENAQEEVS